MTEQHVQIIYLRSDDDIPVIRDRLEWSDADYVILVVPARNRALRSLVNLKLLDRHARNISRKVALVTGDPRTVELCREIDLPTFSSLSRVRRSRWLAGVTEEIEEKALERAEGVTSAVEKRPSGDLTPPGIHLEGRRNKRVPRPRWMPFFRTLPKRKKPVGRAAITRRVVSTLGFLILLVMLAGMMGVVIVFVYPQGQVEVEPASQAVSAELIVQANPEADRVDYATLDIPARLAQVEIRDTASIAPTASSDQPTERAVGTVTFVNRTEEEIRIPYSTTLATSSGTLVSFLTTMTATLPAARNATTQTTVIAVDAGPIGNVAVGQINNIPDSALARRVTVINEAPTSGGAVAPAGVVTRADKDRLWSMILQQLYQEGYERLSGSLGEQEFIPPESLIVLPLDYSYDPSLDGEVTDLLTLEMRAVVRGTVVGGQNANQLALAALQAEIPPGYRLDPLSLEFTIDEVIGVAEQVVSFRIRSAGVAKAQIDEGEISKTVRGLTAEKARSMLVRRFPLNGEPVVMVEPDWLGRLPWFPFRINVTIVE